jgi:hypothetical protein
VIDEAMENDQRNKEAVANAFRSRQTLLHRRDNLPVLVVSQPEAPQRCNICLSSAFTCTASESLREATSVNDV